MKTRYLLTASILTASLTAAIPASAGGFMGFSTFGGRTVMVAGNGEGTRTVFSSGMNGSLNSEVRRTPRAGSIQVDDGKGGWTEYKPQPKSDVIGSSAFGGRTTTVTKTGEDSHTVTTEENGKTSSEVHVTPPKGSIQVDDGKGGWKIYKPLPKSKIIASTTFDGKTTTVTDNGNGTHTVTVVDENGNTSSETHATGR